jgi:hypothetical protein
MEKLNNEQEHILDLIEQKSFTDLSSTEMDLCLKYYSLNELELVFKMKSTEKELAHTHEPMPFALNDHKKKAVVIPLYQAALAIAGCIVICWFVFKETTPEIQYITKEIVHTDTLIQEKTNYDTVTLTVEKKIFIPIIQKDIAEVVTIPENINVPHEVIRVDLGGMNLENKGSSFDEDITSILIQPK